MPKTPRPFPFDADQIDRMLGWARARILDGPDPMAGARDFDLLEPVMGGSITKDGLGAARAFELFTDTIMPTTRPYDHPASLSFVAAAPSMASLAFDATLGAAEIFAGNWDGGAGAVHAENQIL